MRHRSRKPMCFMDFDGTIVDNKYRLYRFFVENIEPQYSHLLTLEEFWNIKRMGINEVEWLNQTQGTRYSVKEWNAKKAEVIEQEHYLQYEKIFEYSRDVLRKLQKHYFLVLVTRRDNENGLRGEIERFKLEDSFDDILILPHGEKRKSELILEAYEVGQNDLLVGDTEDDIRAGVELGVKTFLVLSGIRSRWIVEKYGLQSKVYVIESIEELCKESFCSKLNQS